jgi:acetyl esterase/lipase
MNSGWIAKPFPMRQHSSGGFLQTRFPHNPMRTLMIRTAWWIIALIAGLHPVRAEDRIWKVMAVGDSITEGGSTFSNWRYPLWEKLTAAGYFIEYVGSRGAASRIGTLQHEGYGGQNVEYLATQLQTKFPQNPADIVLLHAGHNYSSETELNLVPRMLAATESIIATCRATRPDVTILLAQVIPSLKLPKYSYIPEFNAALPSLAARLGTATSPVIIVDQATDFDPATDTVADLVHPNAAGAAKMRDQWFDALAQVLPTPAGDTTQPQIIPYKTPAGSAPLNLHVFTPPGGQTTMRPALVFFFGGGWSTGTPVQFYAECRHFAAEGYVAITTDYRISSTHAGATAFDSVADAKSVIRYLRSHAAGLGIDPNRIIAAGASAGGHLAAATALLPGLDDPSDNPAVSPRPDALLLWYPVIDNGPNGYAYSSFGTRYREISPLHNIGLNPPPTLTLLGTADSYIPVATGQDFQTRLRNFGGRADLVLYPGGKHPLYPYRDPSAATQAFRATCLAEADAFLKSLVLVSPRAPFGRLGHPLPPLTLREFNSISHAAWSLTGGRLPAGITLTADGTLNGVPGEAGEFPITLQSTKPGGVAGHTLNLSIADADGPQPLVTSPGILYQNTAYTQALASRGAAGPSQWFLEPDTPLPSGIFLSNEGVLSGTTNAAAGDYPVTLRVTDSSGRSATCTIVLPVRAAVERILDVGDSAVTLTGAWTSSTYTPGYYGSSYHHDGNTLKGGKSVTYSFSGLTPGTWSLSATWITAANRSAATPYRVETSAGTITYLANQLTSNGSWNALGSVEVPADGNARVIISNQNTTGFVTADAVRLSTTTQDSPAERYARWSAALPAGRGPTDDPFKNGWPNLLAFYAGRTATPSAAGRPLLRIQPDGSLRAFFNHALPEFPAIIEGSTNLRTWQTIATSAAALTTPPGFDGDHLVPVPDPALRFFRYKVVLPGTSP